MLEIYLLLINTVTLILFWLDKHSARLGASRIPEKKLFWAALAGGSIGALAGMHLFRHKTLRRSFTLGVPLILSDQVAAGLYLYMSKY